MLWKRMRRLRKLTQHWIEVHVEAGVGAVIRVRCTAPQACEETAPDRRAEGCAVTEYFQDVGSEMLRPAAGSTAPLLIGRVEIRGAWEGTGDDAELWLEPVDHHAVTHDARPGGCCHNPAQDSTEDPHAHVK